MFDNEARTLQNKALADRVRALEEQLCNDKRVLDLERAKNQLQRDFNRLCARRDDYIEMLRTIDWPYCFDPKDAYICACNRVVCETMCNCGGGPNCNPINDGHSFSPYGCVCGY